MKKFEIRGRDTVKIAWSGTFLALALLLPAIAGHVPEIGRALSAMHIPIFICGFLLGPAYGAAVGALAPLFGFVVTGMPPIYPMGLSMAFELAAYGFVSGFIFGKKPSGRNIADIYISLAAAMLVGRLVWGLMMFVFLGFSATKFPFSAFIGGAFFEALPGIILHALIVPPIIFGLQRLSKHARRG
ncbi:MAG: ECF transporter S component [Clostridiales bacterium]|jgi:riboflavin transporter FmnP|nr:ECF transporter S component [Clostridiales bacterium]